MMEFALHILEKHNVLPQSQQVAFTRAVRCLLRIRALIKSHPYTMEPSAIQDSLAWKLLKQCTQSTVKQHSAMS